MAMKLTMKLRDSSPPHLYLDQIKRLIKEDKKIHPMMEGALKMMKKAKAPFIQLATRKEIVFVPEKYMHFERAVEPTTGGFVRVDWSEEEKQEYDNAPQQFFKDILNFYDKLGYDFYDKENYKDEQVEELIKITEPKKKEQ